MMPSESRNLETPEPQSSQHPRNGQPFNLDPKALHPKALMRSSTLNPKPLSPFILYLSPFGQVSFRCLPGHAQCGHACQTQLHTGGAAFVGVKGLEFRVSGLGLRD